MTHTNTEAVSDVFAVLMNGNWSIATRVSASAYGEDTGEQVWSEQGTTAWIGLVGKEDASIALSRRAANSAGGVEVRKLEWDENGEAKTALAIYHVEKGMFGWQWSAFTGAGGFAGAKPLGSEAEAKASAQADFNQRILSVIVSSPVSAEVTVSPLDPVALEQVIAAAEQRLLTAVDADVRGWQRLNRDGWEDRIKDAFARIRTFVPRLLDPDLEHERWMENKYYRSGYELHAKGVGRDDSPYIAGQWTDQWQMGWDYADRAALNGGRENG